MSETPCKRSVTLSGVSRRVDAGVVIVTDILFLVVVVDTELSSQHQIFSRNTMYYYIICDRSVHLRNIFLCDVIGLMYVQCM